MLAALLTVGAELWIWLGNDAAGHRLWAALAAPAIMAPIAVRRLYPAMVGTGVPVVEAIDHTFWNPQFVGYVVAYVCALYALAVWTPPRRFAVGTTVIVVVEIGAERRVAGESERDRSVRRRDGRRDVLVRRVVGDRERRMRAGRA